MTGSQRTKYGSACRNCVKVKCKCAPREGGDSCERCYRLGKPCVVSSGSRILSGRRDPRPDLSQTSPSGARKSASPLLDHSQSEVHDTGLQDLQPQVHGLSGHTEDRQIGNAGSAQLIPQDRLETPTTSAEDPHDLPLSPQTNEDEAFPLNNASSRVLPCAGEPTGLEAEAYLASFRNHMHSFFPIFYLPCEMTSSKLRTERPFLWLSIMCVACPSSTQQLTLGDSIRNIVARKMVCNGEKNLDLLLGLLIFLAWAQYQARYMTFVTDLMQLALSIVFDLGLNKAACDPRGPISFKEATRFKHPSMRPTTPPRGPKTMEQRRAVLGSYVLSSTFARTLKRLDGLKWTSDMDESLSVLSDQPECKGDTTLSIQVRLGLLVDQLNCSNCTWPFGNGSYTSQPDEPSKTYHFEILQSTLRQIEEQISLQLSVDGHRRSHVQLYSTRLLLNEAFLAGAARSPHVPDLRRAQLCDACVKDTKAWFDTFFSMPDSAYVGFTFMFMCNMAYSLLVLVRFSTIKDPAWDRGTVRGLVDILSVCDKLAENYATVSQDRARPNGGPEKSDYFSDAESIFRIMRSIWEQQLTTANLIPDNYEEQTQQLLDELLRPELAADWANPPFLMDVLWQ